MLKYVIFSFWIVLMYPLVDLYLTGIPQIAVDLNAPGKARCIQHSPYILPEWRP